MKSIIPILIFTIITSFVFCQNNDSVVHEIDQIVLNINEYNNFRIAEICGEEFLDTSFLKQPSIGYGKLYAYFIDGELVKIREVIGIRALQEMAITEYYFQYEELIFVYEKEKPGPYVFFDGNGNADYRLETADFKARYYFKNMKIVKRLETGTRQTLLLPNEDFFDSQSKEGQLLYSAERYYQLLISR